MGHRDVRRVGRGDAAGASKSARDGAVIRHLIQRRRQSGTGKTAGRVGGGQDDRRGRHHRIFVLVAYGQHLGEAVAEFLENFRAICEKQKNIECKGQMQGYSQRSIDNHKPLHMELIVRFCA